jgi:hypothetical protein
MFDDSIQNLEQPGKSGPSTIAVSPLAIAFHSYVRAAAYALVVAWLLGLLGNGNKFRASGTSLEASAVGERSFKC